MTQDPKSAPHDSRLTTHESPPHRGSRNLLAFPYFSLQERARRWGLTREAMARAEVDCLAVPNNTGHATALQATARYLTHVGGGAHADVAAVFPYDDEPAAVVRGATQWLPAQPWCTDLREPAESYATGVASRLRELSLPHRRVGVVGLQAAGGAPEDTASHGFLAHLFEAFPSVEWVDFSPQMAHIRSVKSTEEFAFIEQSVRIVDAAYAAAEQAVQPGLPDRNVWAAAFEAICTLGSELPVHVRWSGDHHPDSRFPGPSLRPVEDGWLFLSELEAAWGGYRARGVQPLACGDPDPRYAELAKLVVDVWNDTADRLGPGITLGELQARVAAAAERHAPRTGSVAGALASLALRGCGLGADLPRIPDAGSRLHPEQSLVPGWCFTYQIAARAGHYRLRWGDAVAITPRGARRLGNAPPGIRVARR